MLLAESGVSCPRCGTAECAAPLGWRRRKRVTDLSTGEVFEGVPIRRAAFCDGSTVSLSPAELWRGHSTVSSMLEATVRVLGAGTEAAHEWAFFGGRGESVVSRRTLRRWVGWVRQRLVGSAWAWLGPRLGLSWSDQHGTADQLQTILDQLDESLLLAFRATTGHAVVDKPVAPPKRAPSVARRVAGHLVPSAPHDVSSALRPRGAWCRGRRGRSPPPDRHGGHDA